MRIGLELGDPPDLSKARRADELGLWAVAVGGEAGAEMVRAARVVECTEHVRIVVRVDIEAEHPLTIAEELSVLDNLSGGRIAVLVTGNPHLETVTWLREILIGRAIEGAILAPPPVQTEVAVWVEKSPSADPPPVVARSPSDVEVRLGGSSPGETELSGDLAADRVTLDQWRDAGCSHLLVSWPGAVKALARHLATRAATVDFPAIVADMAEQLEPVESERT